MSAIDIGPGSPGAAPGQQGQTQTMWWRLEGDAMAKAAYDAATIYWIELGDVRWDDRYHRALYYNRPPESDDVQWTPSQAARYGKLRESLLSINLIKSVGDTARARFRSQRPLIEYTTSEGTFEQQQRASQLKLYNAGLRKQTKMGQKLSKFILRSIWSRTAWMLFKVEQDDEGDVQMMVEPFASRNVAFDRYAARRGPLRTVYFKRRYPAEVLKARYPDKADLIEQAKTTFSDGVSYASDISSPSASRAAQEYVVVWECIHLRSGKIVPKEDRGSEKEDGKEPTHSEKHGHDGIWVTCIKGGLLECHPYSPTTLPCINWSWNEPDEGVLGQSMGEELGALQEECSEQMRNARRRDRLAGNVYLMKRKGTQVSQSMQTNELVQEVEYAGNQPPTFYTPSVITKDTPELIRMYKEEAHARVGFFESATDGKMPPGMTSGTAQRVYYARENQRGAEQLGRWADLNVEVDIRFMVLSVHADEDLGTPLTTTSWGEHGTKMTASALVWSKVKIDFKKLALSAGITNEMARDPAGRMQLAEDLLDKGAFDLGDYLGFLDIKDIDEESSTLLASRKLIAMLTDKMLIHGEDLIRGGDDYEAFPPEPWMDLDYAIKRMGLEMMRAMTRGAPKPNTNAALEWITAADDIRKNEMEQMAMIQAQAQAAAMAQQLPLGATEGVEPGAAAPAGMGGPAPGLRAVPDGAGGP